MATKQATPPRPRSPPNCGLRAGSARCCSHPTCSNPHRQKNTVTTTTRASCKTQRQKAGTNPKKIVWKGGCAEVRCCRETKIVTERTPMQLTPRQALLQFGHVLQQELFPHLEAPVGRLRSHFDLLQSV